MNSLRSVCFIAAAFILLCLIAAKATIAGEIIVNPSDPACSPNSTPPCYTTITGAINAAHDIYTANTASTSVITVETGTYNETITLLQGVSLLSGRETARTVLAAGGSGTIMTVSGVTGAFVKHFTFLNAATGILVSGNSGISITNNVFVVGNSGTGIRLQNTLNPVGLHVINNTFNQNGVAIARDADIEITNNIFSQNVVNISQTFALPQLNISNNDFNPTPLTSEPTGSIFIPDTSHPNPDPLFVDSANLDFHLQANSPCIGTGSGATDIGTYGGTDADTIPFRVSGVQASGGATLPFDISVSWTANNAYNIMGYKLYYGYSSGNYNGNDALVSGLTATSPINVGNVTSFILSNLTHTVSTPTAPVMNQPSPLDQSLALSWSAVPGATTYKIHYGITSPNENTVDTGNQTSYTLTGLTNGQVYQLAVSAVAQAAYYISVTAYDNSGQTLIAGQQHESAYSIEQVVYVGTPNESVLSNVVSDFPEPLVAYPNLPNSHQGCFIATAAYGYYSAPQVQALRSFRDRYLLTNSIGNSFVEWYYGVSPAAADFLNSHPGYKPLVRTALLPAVGIALFLTKTSPALRCVFLVMIAACLVAYAFHRKRLSGPGGSR